jgi:hypothetical protein
MIKVKLKHLLSICILLFFGYGHLAAHTFSSSGPKNFNSSELVSVCGNPHIATFGPEIPVYRLNVPLLEEQQDDDLTSFKKSLKSAASFHSILSTQASGSYLNYGKKLPIHEHFSYNSYNLHLLFQVFRI